MAPMEAPLPDEVITYVTWSLRQEILWSCMFNDNQWLHFNVDSYLVCSWVTKVYLQLSESNPASDVTAFLNSLRCAQPIIWWKAVCYHYVRRSRHVTRFRDGGAFTTSQVCWHYVRRSRHVTRFSYGVAFTLSITGVYHTNTSSARRLRHVTIFRDGGPFTTLITGVYHTNTSSRDYVTWSYSGMEAPLPR